MADNQKIQETLARILSDWGMLMVEPLADTLEGVFTHESPLFRASLAFKGPTTGRYEVVCQEPFAKNLAANLLGSDAAEVSTDDALEVLMELINIASGNLVTTMFGEDKVYALSPPQVAVATKELCLGDIQAHSVGVFSGDFEPICFLYYPQ
jgi:hypothetical protein